MLDEQVHFLRKLITLLISLNLRSHSRKNIFLAGLLLDLLHLICKIGRLRYQLIIHSVLDIIDILDVALIEGSFLLGVIGKESLFLAGFKFFGLSLSPTRGNHALKLLT